jgi:mono/diheme cytochrome c family protein
MTDLNTPDAGPKSESTPVSKAGTYGFMAEYSGTAELLHAARIVRDAGYSRWDTYTPFPVHGIEPAMGIRPTRLPWIVLTAGIVGCSTGLLLQWYTNAQDYKWVVSGKPFWSIPAAIPITFELTILFSAITALIAMLVLNNLPFPSHPLDRRPKFLRATNDRFFLVIQTSDPKYDDEETRALLDETKPVSIEVVPNDETPNELPRPVVYGLVILVVLAAVPFAMAAKARASVSRDTRLNLIPDMDYQPKMKADRRNPFFGDERASRSPIEGVVARGELREDTHRYGGKLNGEFAKELPKEIQLTDATMQRGKERFGIYCAPCHGLSGKGDGMVSKRAEALAEGGWVPPTNLHQDYLRKQPDGEIFNTITHGIRNMPAYGNQIPTDDRWAIVLYVRALQRSLAASVGDVPADQQSAIR